jgi:hypothetical protein
MHKVSISGIELMLDNGCEIRHIGGPYICDAYLNNKQIIKQALADNFVYDPSNSPDKLFFVQYHKVNQYVYFTINFYQFSTGSIFEFTREFEKIFIRSAINDHELEVINSFYDNPGLTGLSFNFNEEDVEIIQNHFE